MRDPFREVRVDRGADSAPPRLAVHRLHRSGDRPISALLIGESARLLPEVGGRTLASRAADRIWLSTRRGVDLDVLTDLGPVLGAARAFDGWRLWRYDVVLVAFTRDDAARRAEIAGVRGLVREVRRDADGSADLIVLAPSSAERLRGAVLASGMPRVRFRAVDAASADLDQDRAWATAIGQEVLASAGAEVPAVGRRDRADDEPARQAALDTLRIVGRPPDPKLEDLVELARTAFGTDSAEINFIDRDRQVKVAVAGGAPGWNERAHSFCTRTIERSGPTVVADAMVDPRFRASPLANGPNAIRFYAAHPIESQNGYRIGSFCVFDREPRDVGGLDLAVLRDLALLAQAELTRVDEAPVGSRLTGRRT